MKQQNTKNLVNKLLDKLIKESENKDLKWEGRSNDLKTQVSNFTIGIHNLFSQQSLSIRNYEFFKVFYKEDYPKIEELALKAETCRTETETKELNDNLIELLEIFE